MPRPRSSYESALVVLVPEAEARVGRMRQRYDPSAAVGMPAHITLNYPFLPGLPVDAAMIDQLGVLFSGFPPLRYAQIEVRKFFGTVYLAPVPGEPFMDLIRAVVAQYPQSPPYGGMFAEVVPHLSLAQSENAAELELVLRAFAPGSDGRLPIEAAADEVWLMDNRNERWEKRLAFRLGRSTAG
ncbi:MAG TPA: 2'-5' RNA ligase family protein [Anaerolineales bacterium]|nr:2'-5' RNA ligase family protein [Anaerolineales bacterium]